MDLCPNITADPSHLCNTGSAWKKKRVLLTPSTCLSRSTERGRHRGRREVAACRGTFSPLRLVEWWKGRQYGFGVAADPGLVLIGSTSTTGASGDESSDQFQIKDLRQRDEVREVE